MTQAIVTYLNAVIDTVGRVDERYCMAELRSDGTTTVPYTYVGNGKVKPISIDGGSLSYWRISGAVPPMEQIASQYGKPRLSATYPLRLVIIARRKDSTVDDGFMPTRLAEDIANALTGSHPDLKTLLKANTVSVSAGYDVNITSVWADEFKGTGVNDPNYTRTIMALSVSVTVIGDRACWENECDYDPDILHLFDFCQSGTVARLTDTQVACLEDALCDPCADATITVNTAPFGTAPSGGSLNVPVVNGGANPVGSIIAGEVVIANNATFINGTQVTDQEAEVDANIFVTLNGTQSGAWNAGIQTWEVFTAAPTFDPDTTAYMTSVGIAADGTVYYTGTQYEITGLGMWHAADFLITAMKDLDIYSVTWNGYTVAKEVIVAMYPYIGGTAARHRFNAGDPQALSASKYLTFNGSFTHDGGGVKGLGNGWAETNMLISDFGGLGGGMCYNRSYSLDNTYDFGTLKSGGTSFAYQSRSNNSQIAYAMDANTFGDSRFVQDSRGFSGFMRNTNAQAYWLGRQLVAPFATAAGVGVNTNTIVLHASRNFAGTPTQFRPDQYAGFLFTKYITPSKLTDLSIVWENFNGRLYRAAV